MDDPLPTALDYASEEQQHRSRFARFAMMLLRFHPLLLGGSIYGTWLLGFAILGRPPVPMQDDPKDIGAGFAIPYVITMVLLVTWPFVAMISVCAIIVTSKKLGDWAWLVINAALYCGLYLLMEWDPNRIGEWLFD